MIAPNTIVGGRYRVARALGGGGMKLVYLAEDLRLASRRCALAEMVDSFTSPEMQQQAVAAFQREADMLAQLSNQHIPRIFDRFSEANRHYLVMEYIDGGTLEDELKQNGGKLETARIIDIAIQVLETLEYLHNLEPPVIYRDLKPSNVMLTPSGEAKLIDFGIARHFAPLTNATMIGTQGYAPPEQYRGRVETRSDLYALGATMHQALSGRDPANEPPFSFPPLRKLCPDLDPALAAVVDQALAYDVINRVRDATEFKRRLIEIKTGIPIALGAMTNPARSQMKLPLDVKLPLEMAASRAASTSMIGDAAEATDPIAQASARTMVTVLSDMACPKCGRIVPADSRFCSYCAADLRSTASPIELAHGPEAETAIITPQPGPRSEERREGRDRRPRRRHRKRPWLWIAVIAAVWMGTRLIHLVQQQMTPPPDDGSSASEPAYNPPGADAGVPPSESIPAPGLSRLRAALDADGYSSVHYRMEDGTLVLWGTVPNNFDQARVVMIVLINAGMVPMDDRIQVQDAFAGP